MIFSHSNIGIMFTMFQVHSKVVQNEMAFFDPSKLVAAKEIKVNYNQTDPIQLDA